MGTRGYIPSTHGKQTGVWEEREPMGRSIPKEVPNYHPDMALLYNQMRIVLYSFWESWAKEWGTLDEHTKTTKCQNLAEDLQGFWADSPYWDKNRPLKQNDTVGKRKPRDGE